MSVTYSRRRIRLAIDVTNYSASIDQITGETPFFWQATDIVFELAACWGSLSSGGELLDVSNVATLTLSVVASSRSGSNLMTKTMSSSDMDNTLTSETWADYSKQHVSIPFTASETGVTLSTVDDTFWCVISVTTNDSPGRTITWGAFPIRIMEDGRNTSSSPAGDPSYYTSAESDARYAPLLPSDGTYRIHNGQFQLWDETTDKYKSVWFKNGQLVYGEDED